MANLFTFGQDEKAMAAGRVARLLARDSLPGPEGCSYQHPVLGRPSSALQSDSSGAFMEINKQKPEVVSVPRENPVYGEPTMCMVVLPQFLCASLGGDTEDVGGY